ncbi:MAG: M23 family metallopeptidase [Candidatus Sungbacteria bacterium]|nr:M23 family metallopeptidase [Candidatus Sungbacteria bacterium]
MESIWEYVIPFSREVLTGIVTDRSPAHIGPYAHAIDFLMPPGSVVLAPRGGRVIAMKDDGRLGGPSRSFAEHANYVTLAHGQNEFSELVHLAPASIRVSVGQWVEEGDPLCLTGLTGWLYEPHLHFMVFVTLPDRSFQSRRARFRVPL